MSQETHELIKMPLLALRGLHVFPGMLLTFDVERPASIAALNTAIRADQIIFLSAQKDLSADLPTEEEIYAVGTVCRIRQQLRQPHGNICRVMVEGVMTDIMYRIPSDKTAKKVIVTAESVREGTSPLVLHENDIELGEPEEKKQLKSAE